jgi:hypothetical protein
MFKLNLKQRKLSKRGKDERRVLILKSRKDILRRQSALKELKRIRRRMQW